MLDQVRKPDARLDDDDTRAAPLVFCRRCDAVVARTSDRVMTGPDDLHTFVNPRGEVFDLVCFFRADGAVTVGEPTLEYTWFPGHAWRFAMCRSCAVQLGWRYDGAPGFWGLIRAGLRWH